MIDIPYFTYSLKQLNERFKYSNFKVVIKQTVDQTLNIFEFRAFYIVYI